MASKPYYLQNDGKVSRTPPNYLGTLAKECWRKIVPFLEATERVERIDTSLVEQYCTQYDIYRAAYHDAKKMVSKRLCTRLSGSDGGNHWQGVCGI